MLSMIPTCAKVIDIGCGNSLLPVKLKEKGCAVSVADISKTALNQYKNLGWKVLKLIWKNWWHKVAGQI